MARRRAKLTLGGVSFGHSQHMAPVDKAKAAGVSAGSFFDLRAELAKHEEEFRKNKTMGKSTVLTGSLKRPDKVCRAFAI